MNVGATSSFQTQFSQLELKAKNKLNSVDNVPALLDENRQSDISPADAEVKEAFQNFVGQTLFGSMLKSMRSTVGEPAYFHGGRTEEIFQQQLDGIMTEDLTKSSASSFSDPMFKLFQLNRQG